MKQYRDDTPLKSYPLPKFDGGYNSYSASKLLIQDNEFPQGASNVLLDDNGSVTKRNGEARYSGLLSNGHAITGLGWFRTASLSKAIAACNTAWYDTTAGGNTALTGVTFTADKDTDFTMADGKLFGGNNTDNLAYTTNGTTVVAIGSNGNIGRWPTAFNQRLYMTNATNPDRVYYSNPVTVDLTTNPPTYTGLDTANMFNTDLSASPKKNAGYFILLPGAGLTISALFKDSLAGTDYLFVHTESHGVWRVGVGSPNSDGSLAHSIVQVVPGSSAPAGRSVGKGGNDQWFYDRQNANFATYAEAQGFFNPRVTQKGGRVKSEVNAIAIAGIKKVAYGHFKSKDYFAYQSGSYNDRVIVYDEILNAWGAPATGWNVSCFLVFEELDGTRRLLAGSSLSTDSFVYELETGTNDASTAISASFQTKSTDCGQPGLIKYFGFIDVFYGVNFGTLTYSVILDEVTTVIGDTLIGTSASNPVGIGTMKIGTFAVGLEFNPNTVFAASSQNGQFRIQCNYKPGTRVAVQFTNNNASEQFKINGLQIHYIEGSIYQATNSVAGVEVIDLVYENNDNLIL